MSDFIDKYGYYLGNKTIRGKETDNISLVRINRLDDTDVLEIYQSKDNSYNVKTTICNRSVAYRRKVKKAYKEISRNEFINYCKELGVVKDILFHNEDISKQYMRLDKHILAIFLGDICIITNLENKNTRIEFNNIGIRNTSYPITYDHYLQELIKYGIIN